MAYRSSLTARFFAVSLSLSLLPTLSLGQSAGTGSAQSSVTTGAPFTFTNTTTSPSTQLSSSTSSLVGTGSLTTTSSTAAVSSTETTSSSTTCVGCIIISGIGGSSTTTSASTNPSTTSTTSPSVPLGTGPSSSTTVLSNNTSSTVVPGAVTSPPAVTSLTTTIDGTSTVVPIISGGGVSSPVVLTSPTITFAPTGTQASSSKSAVSTQLTGIFPPIQSWIDDTTEDTGPIITSLEDVESSVEDLLSEIEDASDKDTSKGCTHSLFSLLSCIVDDVTKIKSNVIDSLVDDVTDQLKDLENLTSELDDVEDDDTSSTSSSSSSSSSSSTCTSGTSVTEDYFVTCTPTLVSSSTSYVCNTATSTVTGCTVSASATTTTLSSSVETTSLCAQTGCASCTDTSLPASPTAEGNDYTVVSGVAMPTEGTVAADVPAPSSLSDLDDSTNGTSSKVKRTLPVPQDFPSYIDFFQASLATPGLLNVPHRWGGTGGSSSALVREFQGTSKLYMTVQGLYGCTSLILISRRAVYMSHMFENPGFNLPVVNDDGVVEDHNTFQADIATAIPNGDPIQITGFGSLDGEPWLPNLIALSQAGAIFDPDQEGGVQALIVTPGVAGAYKYFNQISTIYGWVSTQFKTTPDNYLYYATNGVTSNDQTSAAGKVLFQFDPAEGTRYDDFPIGPQGTVYRCPIQYAGWKVWIENQAFLGDELAPWKESTWSFDVTDQFVPLPLPVGQGNLVQRDDAPDACVAVSSSTSSSSSTTTASSTGSTATDSPSAPTTTVPSTLSTVVSSSSTTSNSSITGPITSAASNTTSTIITSTASYISCSHQNQDPDQGINSAYCVCSGSTFSELATTIGGTSANLCAYTALPSTTTNASPTAIATTTAACYACTIYGQANESCTFIADCTQTPTSTSTEPPATTTVQPLQTCALWTECPTCPDGKLQSCTGINGPMYCYCI